MNFLKRKLIWLVVGAGVRQLFRMGTARTIDQTRDELAERLPDSVVKVADRLPVDPLRTGSSFLVAGKATKKAADASAKARGYTADGLRTVTNARRKIKQLKETVSGDFYHEVDDSTREFRSDYLRTTHGDAAATDALLDLRATTDGDDDPLDAVPSPVRPGRRRWRPGRPAPKIRRMQRSYLPPVKPWDRRS